MDEESPTPAASSSPPKPTRQGAEVRPAGAVYALGTVGALVWFWRRADTVSSKLLAPAKAVVWPALLVHAAFKAFDRRPGAPPPP